MLIIVVGPTTCIRARTFALAVEKVYFKGPHPASEETKASNVRFTAIAPGLISNLMSLIGLPAIVFFKHLFGYNYT